MRTLCVSCLFVMLMSDLDLCLSVGVLGGLSHNCTVINYSVITKI